LIVLIIAFFIGCNRFLKYLYYQKQSVGFNKMIGEMAFMQEPLASITGWIENYGKQFIVPAAFAFLIQCTNNDPAFSNLSLSGKGESYV
jgi:hypothetical protein